jgi:phosphoglycolate phosphatase
MIKTIIFDYDGVIVDSFPTTYAIYKVICSKLNKRLPSTIEGFKEIYTGVFTKLYVDLGISKDESEAAENIYREEVKKQNPVVFPGIKDVFEELTKKYNLVILSSNYTFNIKQKLKQNDLENYFSEIIAKTDLIVDSFNKTQPLIDFIEKNNLKKEEVIMVGDRDVDYMHAENAGIRSIIVEYGWGHTDKVPTPNPKIEKPIDLLKAIELVDH